MVNGASVVRGTTWRWGFYALSLGFAFSELITGLVAQQKDEWVLPWVISYALWTLVIFMFTWSCHRASPQRFVVSSFGCLVCTAATLALLGMLGATSETNLYIWIPFATNCGIFVGLATRDLVNRCWTSMRTLYSRLTAGFHTIIRGEGHDELPIHIPTSSTTAPDRRYYSPSSNPLSSREFSHEPSLRSDTSPI